MEVISSIDGNAGKVIRAWKIYSVDPVHKSHHLPTRVKCHLCLPNDIRLFELGNGIIDRKKA